MCNYSCPPEMKTKWMYIVQIHLSNAKLCTQNSSIPPKNKIYFENQVRNI